MSFPLQALLQKLSPCVAMPRLGSPSCASFCARNVHRCVTHTRNNTHVPSLALLYKKVGVGEGNTERGGAVF